MFRTLTSHVHSDNFETLLERLYNPAACQGRIKPAQTELGIVAVEADEYLDYAVRCRVVVATGNRIYAASHIAKRPAGDKPRDPSKDQYKFCYIGERQYEIGGLSYDWPGRMAEEVALSEQEERLGETHKAVSGILDRVVNGGSAYDPLHRLSPKRYPTLEKEGIKPFAGMEYGPRINLGFMLKEAGVNMHPAVIEAFNMRENA